MPFALRISFHHKGDANPAASRIVDGLIALDPNAWISVFEGRGPRLTDVTTIRTDFGWLRRVWIGFTYGGEACQAELELAPQLTLTIRRLPVVLSIDDCAALFDTIAQWSAVDFGSVQWLDKTIGPPGSLDYLRRAAINIADARYERLGPIVPGAVTRISDRLRGLCIMPWTPIDGRDRPTETDYLNFCDAGLGARCELVDGRASFTTPATWRPLPPVCTQLRAPDDAGLLAVLAATVGRDEPTDLETLEVKAGTSFTGADLTGVRLWFLGASDLIARWALLDDAQLLECGFEASDLTGCSFARARIDQSLFTDCRAWAWYASGTVIKDCRFVRCDLSRSSWRAARIGETRFDSCEFGDVDFAESTHAGSEYIGCKLEPAARAHILATGGTVFDTV